MLQAIQNRQIELFYTGQNGCHIDIFLHGMGQAAPGNAQADGRDTLTQGEVGVGTRGAE